MKSSQLSCLQQQQQPHHSSRHGTRCTRSIRETENHITAAAAAKVQLNCCNKVTVLPVCQPGELDKYNLPSPANAITRHRHRVHDLLHSSSSSSSGGCYYCLLLTYCPVVFVLGWCCDGKSQTPSFLHPLWIGARAQGVRERGARAKCIQKIMSLPGALRVL